jgi:ubiquinone/menaquinone biosynthesis C-methylase UbiE
VRKNFKLYLGNYTKNRDGIYIAKFEIAKQITEYNLRKKIASIYYKNYFLEISKYHSIPVMINEVSYFLKNLKKNSIILDIGCGWCWHWKQISILRPDVTIFALDFVKENFLHAKNILSKDDLKQIIFVNSDIHNVKLPSDIFDAVWTVQSFQHIPKPQKALKEVHRVMKQNAEIYYYTLNNSIFVKLKNIFNTNNHINNYYYLERDNKISFKNIKKIFNNEIQIKYSEIIFHPEIKFFFGKKKSLFGKLDSYLTGNGFLKSYFARQVLFITKK